MGGHGGFQPVKVCLYFDSRQFGYGSGYRSVGAALTREQAWTTRRIPEMTRSRRDEEEFRYRKNVDRDFAADKDGISSSSAGFRRGFLIGNRFASLGKAIRDRERTYGDNTRRVEDTANVIPSSHRLVILSCCRWLLSPLIDPSIERWNAMRENVYKNFRFTSTSSRQVLVFGAVVPALIGAACYFNDATMDWAGKKRGESLRAEEVKA
ncbi:hypothetical protein NCC49_001959 [Naganishia albida]|nr:hypothetical protein NCC49_001959 [Naganishia albida]